MLQEGARVAYEGEDEASGTVIETKTYMVVEYFVRWDDPDVSGLESDWYPARELELK